MARVHRRRDRRAEIHIAEAEHQVAGVEHHALHVIDAVEAIDATDELEIARAPRRVRAHRLHVFLDRQPRLRVVPRERQVHDARRQLHVLDRRQLALAGGDQVEQRFQRQPATVVVHLQRTDSGREVDDAR